MTKSELKLVGIILLVAAFATIATYDVVAWYKIFFAEPPLSCLTVYGNPFAPPTVYYADRVVRQGPQPMVGTDWTITMPPPVVPPTPAGFAWDRDPLVKI